MTTKYFTIDRIKAAIEHLQNYDSNWILPPLVFAVNNIGFDETRQIGESHGGDPFLQKFFSGELIGLSAFDSGANTLRPRFSDIMSTFRKEGKEQDYVIHQNTKLWANVYSSRGYREMRNARHLTGMRGNFRLESSFPNAWEQELPDTFHFEELLVWLYAFSGLPSEIEGWKDLLEHFQERFLGEGNSFLPVYSIRFHVKSGVPWPTQFLEVRPEDSLYQNELMPTALAQQVNPRNPKPSQLNKIFYGAPGSGKSYTVKQAIGASPSYVTTFHPEHTYADFFGSYRPSSEAYGTSDERITYRFHPEVFLKAYTTAWKKPDELVYLVIEEINRGNSAAIFGDIFQLLDRASDGYSTYSVSAREEVSQYLRNEFAGSPYEERLVGLYNQREEPVPPDPFAQLLLPDNLYIYATMNTSDQSLFPMDSAFKRRWGWQYIPINYDETPRYIDIEGVCYSWNEFLMAVNGFIYELLETEDKCLGPYFVDGSHLTIDDFRNKVLFYLWNDILRDELPDRKLQVFPRRRDDEGNETDFPVNFNDFFDPEFGIDYIHQIFKNLDVPPLNADVPVV